MGRNRRNRPDSGSKSEDGIFTLESVIRRIGDLEERVSRLEDPLGGARFPQPTPVRRGPKIHIEHAEVLRRRDQLIHWVESCWPTLSLALARAATSDEALKAMMLGKKMSPRLFMPTFYEHLEQFRDELWSFLQSKRYRGNPRNLCGAMAGIPEIAWKTSFDICSRVPSTVIMHSGAYRDFLRRKFPDRLRELDRADSIDEVIAILKKSPTKDRHYVYLKENPDKVLEWVAPVRGNFNGSC